MFPTMLCTIGFWTVCGVVDVLPERAAEEPVEEPEDLEAEEARLQHERLEYLKSQKQR